MEHSEYYKFINDRAASHIEAANVFKLATVQVYSAEVLRVIAGGSLIGLTSNTNGISVKKGETTFIYKY